MALIIEDGSRPVGANSYISLADTRAYALARGITLAAVDAELEAQIIGAMDYFESYSERFIGDQYKRDQPLSWPREGVVIDGWPWSSIEIPRQVITAQLMLVIEIHEGADPYNPPKASLPAIRKKVDGAVEVQYANPVSALKVSKTQKSSTMISALLKNSGMFAIRS